MSISIHVTSGVYQDHVNTKAFSSMFDKHGCNLDLAEAIKKNVHVPVVAVGGFNGPDQVEEPRLRASATVALGRQQSADPAFVNKTPRRSGGHHRPPACAAPASTAGLRPRRASHP